MRNAAGFSLLELLVASALGATLGLALLQFAASMHRGAALIREQAFVRQRAIEAATLLRGALAESGYGVCRDAGGRLGADVRARGGIRSRARGFAIGFAEETGAAVADHDTRTRTLTLDAPAAARFGAGDWALLAAAACGGAALLKVEQVHGARLRYADARIARRFEAGSTLRAWREEEYYIGRTARGTPALFRRRLGRARGRAIVDGIETLRLEYAVDSDADAVAERYVDAVSDARTARALHLTLGVRSRMPLPARAGSADGFLRRRVEWTIALPNGGH